jgi:sugar lactone lactonase YvrE
MTQATSFLAAGAVLAEGPLWWPEQETVAWVDILRNELHLTRFADRADTVEHFDGPVGTVGLTTDGGVVVAGRRGLQRVDAAAGHPLVAAFPGSIEGLRSNEGKPGPDGRFYVGTMGYPEKLPGIASFWRFDGATPTQLLADVTISNGIGWSPDLATMFYIDTPTQRIDAFDFDVATGSISGRRPLVTITEDLGAPDGLCVDADGRVWVALWGGSAVHCYDGATLVDVVDVPTPYVSSATFAGPGLDQLVITTASEPYGGTPEPGAGDLYLATPGARGQLPFRYRPAGSTGAP